MANAPKPPSLTEAYGSPEWYRQQAEEYRAQQQAYLAAQKAGAVPDGLQSFVDRVVLRLPASNAQRQAAVKKLVNGGQS